MPQLRAPFALAVLVAGFPVAVLADLNQTTTLTANTSLNLDTGATANSGGDILWTGSAIAPQGNATAVVIYTSWPVAFFNTISSILVSLFPGYSKNPIPSSNLGVEVVFGVHTNGGHYAKVIVTANSGGSITLRFTTFGVAAGTGGGTVGPPTITSVRNNSSLIAPGLPNYGIAPSSIFVVVGTGLADPGLPVLQSSAPPGLPLTLNGASIAVVVNGVTTRPALYYTSPTQLAAVLPAATPLGTGTLTVTYKGVTSNAATIQVVASALGINIYYTNSGVATDAATGALLTYTQSGTPGQNIVLWTTGLGADPADSDSVFTSTPHAVNTPLQIYIGGIAAIILYQGSAGYPGVNQINLTIPPNAPDGCWISLAAVAGGVVSNVATLPINRNGGECADAVTGLTGSQVAPSTQTLRTGLVGLIQTNAPGRNGGPRRITNSADGAFIKYTGIYTPTNSVSPGGCIVNDLTPNNPAGASGLDVGTITLAGPSGPPVMLASQPGIKGTFYANLADGAIPASGGTFKFTASGGADVGPFTSTIVFSNPLLTWTNQSAAATIDRTQGLTVTWSGGNPGTFVIITGTSSTPSTGAGLPPVAGFTCLAAVDDGRFVIPAYILSALPAGKGGMVIQNDVYGSLTATGLDIALALGDISISVESTYN